MKKIIAIALSVLMIITLLPLAAFAADVVPQATAQKLAASELKNLPTADGRIDLDVGYRFVAEHDKDTIGAFAENNKYANCPADFLIKTDSAIPAGAVTLAGFYAHNDDNWVTMDSDGVTTEFRLLESLDDGYVFTYKDIAKYVGTFYCGAKANNADAYGKSVTVELRLFPANEASVLLDSFSYTFAAPSNDVVPQATAQKLAASELVNLPTADGTIDLDVGYKFVAAHDKDTIGAFAENNKYASCPADFVIKTSEAIPAGAVTLAGFYAHNDDNWVTMDSDGATTEFRLLESLDDGYVFTYKDIVKYVGTFYCGAKANNADADGKEITVELRLFPANEPSILVDSFSYTFAAPANDVLPHAEAIALGADELSVETVDGALDLDVGYKFVAEHDKDTIAAFAANNKYANCPMDFVIKTDEVIPAGAVTLAGFYAHNADEWVAINSNGTSTEFRLLESLDDGYTFTYKDVAKYVGTFYCGAKANNADAYGKTMTVELRVFPEGEESQLIAKFDYTFVKTDVTDANNGSNLTVGGELVYNAYIDAEAYGVTESKGVLKVRYNKNSDINRQPEYVTETIELDSPVVEEYINPTSEYNETYKISKKVAPAQITEPVYIELYASETATEPLASIETSVYKMIQDTLADSSKPESLKAFYRAMIDYAKAAQVYFGYRVADLADVAYTGNVEGLDYNTILRPTPFVGRDLAPNEFSLTCLSSLEANIYYPGDEVAVTSVGGVATGARYERFEGKSRIVVSGILAQDICEAFTFTTTAGDRGNVSMSASSIIRAVLITRAGETNLTNLMSAVYLYGRAASAYFYG